MKNLCIIILFLSLAQPGFGQQADSTAGPDTSLLIGQEMTRLASYIDSLGDRLVNLESQIAPISGRINRLRNQSQQLSGRTDSLRNDVLTHQAVLDNLAARDASLEEVLGQRIDQTAATAGLQVKTLSNSLSRITLYWIIAGLVVALLTVIGFVFLRKKVSNQHSSIHDTITRTRKELEEEAIRLDEKLVTLLEAQMRLIQETSESKTDDSEEKDHSLALKVANEIVRIENNLSHMDPSTKGLRLLVVATRKMKEELEANEYELLDMVGKPYNDGIKGDADFIADDSLEPDQQIISRIIKPQVNYKGRMIQSAHIVVAQGN